MSSVLLLVFVVPTDRDARRAVKFQVGHYPSETRGKVLVVVLILVFLGTI
jgi:hypothetical protein